MPHSWVAPGASLRTRRPTPGERAVAATAGHGSRDAHAPSPATRGGASRRGASRSTPAGGHRGTSWGRTHPRPRPWWGRGRPHSCRNDTRCRSWVDPRCERLDLVEVVALRDREDVETSVVHRVHERLPHLLRDEHELAGRVVAVVLDLLSAV